MRGSDGAGRNKIMPLHSLQNLNHMILVGVNTQVSGDGKRLLHDLSRGHIGVLQQGARAALCA